MKVEGILEAKGTDVETVEPDARVETVVHRLMSREIGAIVVSKDGARVDGVISERDVVRGLEKYRERVLEMRARDIMSRNVLVCYPEDSLKRVMSDMTRTRSRHLPVLRDGVLCGIISVGDVVKHRLEEIELETGVLRDHYILSR
ncbi:MAG: CBS domain-containing protein [Actinomycetota bacterium]|nr:CBS domain-containing protein [Actinomycetota bacterium]